ncbi:tail length tape measure protein [Salmonella enterica subsp. enterica]|uniref:Tail length tape measure protein n=1 Tax=Salmonella enterica I TaxID=59201 RepID=A0A379VTI6_SALET|nr:tail length tape measure protein [Salmonella enterica subsp. enterica]
MRACLRVPLHQCVNMVTAHSKCWTLPKPFLLGLKLSGASTAEASSVITQFSQALAQGVLRGEEFNSVNENGDRVIRALAAGMGVARKDLKAMADQGLLTADKVVPALISQLGTMRGEFEAMPQTVSAATTKLKMPLWPGLAEQMKPPERQLLWSA